MNFSIVTVTKNNAVGVDKTWQSLQCQTFQHFEWIVVNGGNDSHTDKIINAVDVRYLTYVHESDTGIYDAMNKGIDVARGDYIIFMNAGDCFVTPNVLQDLSHYTHDFVYGDAIEDGHHKPSRPIQCMRLGLITHHQAMVYKRDAIGGVRYNTNYKIAADYDFTLRVIERSKSTQYAPQLICVFETGGVSQRQTRLGRLEQFTIRKRLQVVPLWGNALIMVRQSIAQWMRHYVPSFYWRVRSSRNIGHADKHV